MLVHTGEAAAHHLSYHGCHADFHELQDGVELMGERLQVRGGAKQGQEGEQGLNGVGQGGTGGRGTVRRRGAL